MIDFWASAPHYAAHLVPIVEALDPAVVGCRRAPHCVAGPAGWQTGRPTGGDMLVVAAWRDAQTQFHKYERVVLVEHGAGQHYRRPKANHPNRSRSDAAKLHAVIGPNERVASTPGLAVGCPKLDRWHTGRGPTPPAARPVVAVSTHWDSRVDPIWSGTIWREWVEGAVASLARDGYDVLGHWHPRLDPAGLRRVYDRYGVEPVADFADVLDRAHLYICDNSSTIFEFASCDRPVILVHTASQAAHPDPPGGRYWHWSQVGTDVPTSEADRMGCHASAAWERRDDPGLVRIRTGIVDGIYRHRDGHAAQRAAQALEHML